MISKPPVIILNAATLGPSSTGAASGGTIDLLPWTDWSWATELTFYIIVTAINGSPSSGTLTAKFQLGGYDSINSQFTGQHLVDLDTAQKSTLISEGEDWGTILSYNTSVSTPVVVKRTITKFGSICNLHLDASGLSGGTNSTFTVTVMLTAKQV